MSNRKIEEEIKKMNIPDPTKTLVEFIGKDGEECDEYSSLAKRVTTTYGFDDVRYQYFVRVGRGELVDPYGIDINLSRKRVSEMFKFKKVGAKAYDSFVKYLTTKNKIHFTTARRLLVSER